MWKNPGTRTLGVWFAALGLLLWPVAAAADQWEQPSVQIYYSPDHHTRLTVIPRDVSSPLAYFQDKVDHKKLAGQRPGSTRTTARGVLERQDADGSWAKVWDRSLVNDVSPVSALVANGGRAVVTFDNWHSMGLGKHVVVIYGADGSSIRSRSLGDLLPDYYIKALPRSVSSLWWSGEHHLSAAQDAVILKVVVPSENEDEDTDKKTYVDLAVSLTSGQPQPLTDPAWQAALSRASHVAKAKQAAEDAAKAAFIAPLTGPTTTGEREWHQYLGEAFFRIDPDWKESFPTNIILRAPDAGDYAPSETWVREAFDGKGLPNDIIMLASPSAPENLVKVLMSAVQAVRPNAPKKSRIYVAVPPAYCDPVAVALAPTGAKFICLDPAKPIPQRKERLAMRRG